MFPRSEGEELHAPKIHALRAAHGANGSSNQRSCTALRPRVFSSLQDGDSGTKARSARLQEAAAFPAGRVCRDQQRARQEPIFYGAEHIAVRGNAVEHHSRGRQKNQKCERGQERCQNFRLRNGGVVGVKGQRPVSQSAAVATRLRVSPEAPAARRSAMPRPRHR